MKKFLIFIIIILNFNTIKAQSDDGWFSHFVGLEENFDFSEDYGTSIYYTGTYNFNNILSAGITQGFVFENDFLITILPTIKARFFKHKKLIPGFNLKTGYATIPQKKEGGFGYDASFYLETIPYKMGYFINLGIKQFGIDCIDSPKASNFYFGLGLFF